MKTQPIYTTGKCHAVQSRKPRMRIGTMGAALKKGNLDKWEIKRMQIAASMKRIKN